LVNFCLIDAENVRGELVDEVVKCVFVENASYSIDVPHGNFDALRSPAVTHDAAIGLLFLEILCCLTDNLLVEFSRP
jgi:hypothetical protein